MSQLNLNSNILIFPQLPTSAGAASLGAIALDLTGETLHMCGQIYFAGGYSSDSKTISAAGGGKIHWRTSTVTFANAGTTFKVGIQDLSSASNPSQGDGTFDVYASFTGGGGGITGGAAQSSTMTSGSKTLTHGQDIAVTFEMTARAGADSVTPCATNPPKGISAFGYPGCTDNTSGSYVRSGSAYPMAIIQFDDGTLAYFVDQIFMIASSATVDFALDTATADEYANIFYNTVPVNVIGVTLNAYPLTSVSADSEVILYSDPLGTPVAERTYVWDATISQGVATGGKKILFATPFLMRPYTSYAISLRPTVNAQSVRTYSNDMPLAAIGSALGFGQYCYAARRLNNTGPFADYNGGTAKTRYMHIALITDSSGQDSHFAQSQIGM